MLGRFKYKQTICVGMLLKKFFSFIVLKKCYFAAANVIPSRIKTRIFLRNEHTVVMLSGLHETYAQ